MAISHAGHDHPSTAAARGACRRKLTIAEPVVDARPVVKAPAIKWTAASVRRAGIAMGKAQMMREQRDNARIQPRRSGARVSARNTSCVQAALHIDAHGGRCACGWTANKVA